MMSETRTTQSVSTDYVTREESLNLRISKQLCEQWVVNEVPDEAKRALMSLLRAAIFAWPGRGLRITAQPIDFDE